MESLKSFLAVVIILAGITVSVANSKPMARLDINGRAAKVKLSPGRKPVGGEIYNAGWLGDQKSYYIFSQSRILKENQWEDYVLSFTPGNDGIVSITLLGPYLKGRKGKGLRPVWIYWSDVVIEGATLLNGNFEKIDSKGKPEAWRMSAKNYIQKDGKKYIKVWHNSPASQKIKVKKGREVIIKAKVRKYLAPRYQFDLSSVVNMGFADKVAGDGKGGWSDQGGAARDMRGFNTSRSDYGGVNFKVIDPAENSWKAVITFDSPYAKTGLKQVKLPVPTGKSCRFLYLLHSSCWTGRESGKKIGTITVNYSNGTSRTLPVKTQIEVADWASASHLKNGQAFSCKKAGDDIDKALFLSKFDLGKTAKKISSITLASNAKIVWIVVAATLSDKHIDLGVPNRIFKEGNGWKAVKMKDLSIKPGSALDFSRLIESGPAGKHGRAIVGKNGILSFKNKPNREIRFAAVNSLLARYTGIKDRKTRMKKIEQFSRQVKIHGYNLMRYWVDINVMDGSTKDLEFNPDSLDYLDYQIAQSKAHGIYAFIDLATYGMYMKNYRKGPFQRRDIIKTKMFLGDKRIRHFWKTGVEKLFSHINPYTKVAWKDEPAIVFVDFYNEQKSGIMRILSSNFKLLDIRARKLCLSKWRMFLKKRYQTSDKLAKAWRQAKLAKTPFDAMPLPHLPLVSLSLRSQEDNDYCLFLMELQRETMAWYLSVVRKVGYKGLCSSGNIIGDFKDGAVRSESCDLVIANRYFAHPSKFTKTWSRCQQKSSITTMASVPRDLSVARLWDRPFMITEWGHAFWNQYQHEAGLMNPAYFSFQGFNAILTHVAPVLLTGRTLSNFSIGGSPIGRANEFLSTCLFLRGDIAKSPHRVKLLIDKAYLEKGCNAGRSVSGDQSKIALVSGFGLDFRGWSKPSGVVATVCDMLIKPLKGASVSSTNWTARTVDKKSSINRLSRIYQELRNKGILNSKNISNPAKGIFQSDTGEITLFCQERKIKIKTARTEGICLNKGRSEIIDVLSVNKTSEPAVIAACSVDDKNLEKSRRIVLVYSTFAVNTGMELSHNLITLFKLGKSPVLMKTGTFEVSLRNTSGKKYELYALGFNGSRRERLPVDFANGILKIKIDTSKLKDGPTTFFEIINTD